MSSFFPSSQGASSKASGTRVVFSCARRGGQQHIPTLRQCATKGQQHIFYWSLDMVGLVSRELSGYGKTLSAQQHFDGQHVWDNRITLRDRLSIHSMKHEPTHPSAEHRRRVFLQALRRWA